MPIWFEVIKVLISWPFTILILGLGFGIGFRSEIAQLLRNIASIKLPGGAEILTIQPPPPENERRESAQPADTPPEPPPGVITLTQEDQAAIRSHIEALTQQATNVTQEKEQLLEAASSLIAEKQREARYWWFMYLGHFLVFRTKLVLKWLSEQSYAPSRAYYHETWKDQIPELKEREAILMALFHHGLIEDTGQGLRVTDAGREFLHFSGATGGLNTLFQNK